MTRWFMQEWLQWLCVLNAGRMFFAGANAQARVMGIHLHGSLDA